MKSVIICYTAIFDSGDIYEGSITIYANYHDTATEKFWLQINDQIATSQLSSLAIERFIDN